MANAGATGVVLDVLCQAPRHHPAWQALSTAGTGLLAVLVRCEGSTEAAQPQALRMMLMMLESGLTCGPARQAVATALHCLVAQRTDHRDKLIAAGALPVIVRVLRRLDVLCDLVAVQELLWTLVYLTDEAAVGMDVAAAEFQPAVAESLMPLLFLYGMPWHTQHGHMAALATRALHVQVAGHDVGKDLLRKAGALSVLVELVRRHSAPYVAAASQSRPSRRLSWAGTRSRGVGADAHSRFGPPEGVLGDEQPGHDSMGHGGQHPSRGAAAGRTGLQGTSSRDADLESYVVAVARPPPHQACDVHADCAGTLQADVSSRQPARVWSPYGCLPSAASGTWTPWQRLLAVLLVQGLVPGLAPEGRRRAAGAGTLGSAAGVTAAAAAGGSNGAGPGVASEDSGTPSAVSSEDGDGVGSAAAGEAASWDVDADEGGAVAARVHLEDAAGASTSSRGGPVVEGARVACYGLLLPLLAESEGMPGGAGSAAAAVAGGLLRRRLCPLRESLATLKTLLCDSEDNQLAVADLGLAPLLVQLVAHGDMGLAWQAAEAAVHLSGGATGAELVSAGAAEEMAYLLQESAEALHGLTLRKQIQVQSSSLVHGSADAAGRALQPPGRPTGLQRSLSGSRFTAPAGACAAPGPAPLPAVHVKPVAAVQTGRPARVFLVGRLHLDFTTSGSCFYGSHDAASYCDYCTPSAAIKVLLRLMSATPSSPWASAAGSQQSLDQVAAAAPAAAPGEGSVGSEARVCRRFAAAGGMYGVLLLLHHEGAGVHHSKLAASLLTLLDRVLVNTPGAQDELRAAGGLGVLTALLCSLMRPGVMDVYQLRVATCRTLSLALKGNPANKLAAREQGLLPLLVSLLTVLAGQRKSRSNEVVVDDTGPLTSACLEALEAAALESPGTQEALIALGVMHPVCDLVKDVRLDAEVRTAAVRALTAIVDACPAGHSGALALGVVPAAVSWLDRWRLETSGDASRSLATPTPTPATAAATAAAASSDSVEPALALVQFVKAMLHPGSPHAKSAIVGAGALSALLYLLRMPAPRASDDGTAGLGARIPGGGAAEAVGVTAPAVTADVLSALAEGDTDLQNELVSQGVLTAAAEILRGGGAATPEALRLLTAVMRSNTFVKNTARHTGLAEALVAAVRRLGLSSSAGAAAAAAALTEMAAGNHANQDAIAIQGGLEVAVDLAREGLAALRLGVLAGEAIGSHGQAASGSDGVDGDGSSGRGSGSSDSESDESTDRDLEPGHTEARDTDGDAAGPGPGSAAAAARADATRRGRRRDLRDRGRDTTTSGSSSSSSTTTTTAAATLIAGAASQARLLRALFGLVAACVELNGGNKEYVRELGGVALLGEFLLAGTEALIAPAMPRGPGVQAAGGRLRRRRKGRASGADPRLREALGAARTALSAAMAAACGAVAALVRESGANLARLEEQPGLGVALFKLLVASDAPTAGAAALAIEWLVLRTSTYLTAPSREVFEADLVDLLSMALYVPYAAVPLQAHAGVTSLGAGAAEPRQQPPRQGQPAAAAAAAVAAAQHSPWHSTVTALMPSSGLSAAAVRDAAGLLAAIADVADALEAQQHQHQPSASMPGQGPNAHQLQAGGAAANAAKAKQAAVWVPAINQVALPRLKPVPQDSVASDHSSGLMLSSALAGQAASNSNGPGSQSWWAELAGRAAAAFQKVANGALQGATEGPGGAAATAAVGGGGASAAGGAAALPPQSGSGPAGPGARGSAAAAGTGGAGSTAAMERRRQVAWMLFLLAVKSPDHRARLRRLVRTSLTPLAQQLANAEACRAQLEAATLAAADVAPSLATGSVPLSDLTTVSSAVLESASSIKGRLPVSTAALEIGAAEVSGHRPTAAPSLVPLAPAPALTAAPQPALFDNPEHQQQYLQQLQTHRGPAPQPPERPAQTSLPAEAPRQPPPPSGGRPRSTPSAFPATYEAQGPAGQAFGAGGRPSVLYGSVAPPLPVAASRAAALRGPSALAGIAGSGSAGEAAGPLRDRPFARLSRTGSGGMDALPYRSSQYAGAAAAASGAAGAPCPPRRTSLSGAAAAAFAPYPGSTSASRGSKTASPALATRGVSSGSGSGSGVSVPRPGAMAPQQPPQQALPADGVPASQRALHAQVSAGGSSGIMSDDDELAMIQQEVALLGNTTSAVAWGGTGASVGPTAMRAAARTGYQSGGSGSSPAASPMKWGRF